MTGMCLPGSQIRGLSVLSTRDKKRGSFGTGHEVLGKKGVIGYSIATYSVNLNAIVQNGSILRGSARNFAKIARPARENFEFWHRVRARFCKKGGHWVPNSKTRGHQVLEGTKKGVIGYRTDQKRGSIDRHMTRTHILECPPPGNAINFHFV